MNRRYSTRRWLIGAAFVLSWANSSHAQSSAATPASTDTKEEVIELSPFSVSTSKDVGFVAASALAGGRLSTDLKTTPAAYSVLTREAIDALNISDLTTATKWTVNSNNVPDDGRGTMFADEQSTKLSFRGVTSNQQQIDFFPVYYDYDSYNLERFDFARGPNSILFGSGSFGGTPNATVKKAHADAAKSELRVSIASWNNYRATVDVNQPITKNLALRVNVLWQDSDTWRDHEFNKKFAEALSVAYRPWKGGELFASADLGQFNRNVAVATLGDRISSWDGVTVFSGIAGAAGTQTVPGGPGLPSTAIATAHGVSRTSAATYLVYSPSIAGVMDWKNTGITAGGSSAGSSVGGTLITGAGVNYAGNPLLNAINMPDNALNIATANSQFRLPDRSFTTALDKRSFRQDYDTYTLTFNQQVGEHIFLNASGNYSYGDKTTDYTAVRGLADVYIDINKNLPTGDANPNYLVPYDESIRFLNLTSFLAHNYRTSAAFVFNKTRFGDFRLNTEVGDNTYTTHREQYTYAAKDPAQDIHTWSNPSNSIRYRYYWNQPSRPEPDISQVTLGGSIVPAGFVLDTTRPANTIRTIADAKYGQVAFNANLFDNKLNLLTAIRRDDYSSVSDQSIFQYDYAPGWDGYSHVYKPRPPSDYFSLPLSRPRTNGVGVVNGKRYQDDYSTPEVKGALTTYSAGGVYSITKWASVFANYAETYLPPSPSLRVNGGVFQPLLSKGWDAGLRFNLLNDHVVISLTRYAGRQTNVALGTGTGNGFSMSFPGAINSIIDANPLNADPAIRDNPDPAAINKQGLAEVPFVYSDTAEAKTQGYELEIVANVTKGWRVLANAALPKATQSNAYADTRAYLATNDAVLKQILADAGVTVDANNVATVNPGNPGGFQQTEAQAAVIGWNTMQSIRANFVSGSQRQTRLSDMTLNLFSDYVFQQGALKDFRFGGGVNFRGKEVIGFRGADTIVNPSNPAVAIDNPNVDGLTPVYRNGYHTVTAVFGYVFKLKNNYRLQFDLTIDNLLNEDKPLYYNTVMRPPGGDLSSPARVATPNQYSYLTPRSYTLTASLKF